jgi:hypothetical protein
MTAANGPVEPDDILPARDALLYAAQINRQAVLKWEASNELAEGNPLQGMAIEDAHALAVVAHGLTAYAATVGRWAAR